MRTGDYWHADDGEPKEAAVEWQERVVLNPDILLGKLLVKGTRLAVEFIIDLMAEGSEAQLHPVEITYVIRRSQEYNVMKT